MLIVIFFDRGEMVNLQLLQQKTEIQKLPFLKPNDVYPTFYLELG